MIKYIKTLLYGTLPFCYLSLFAKKSPQKVYRKYFMKHGYTRNPYPAAEKYADFHPEVYRDETNGLSYVLHRSGRRLYYPLSYDAARIKNAYKSVLIEQDAMHPHHYVDSLDEFKGKILLDIGSAEGFTSRDAIEQVGKVYLFECEPEWIEVLKTTFAPWKDKCEIIEKRVSSVCNDNSITLDEFLKDRPIDNLFLKMDIEGAECAALCGAKELFSKAMNMDFAICTYHRKNDAKDVAEYLNTHRCTWHSPQELFYVKHGFRVCLLRGKSLR